jgi:5-methylcytosine-specific restriction enzyme A
MTKLRTLGPRIRTINSGTVRLPPKQMDPVYNTPEYQAWRAVVVQRAGHRCEAVDNGHRCSRARPDHRMYADHIIELRDGGALLDPSNGQCLCASHHELKTVFARARRLKD